MSYKTSYFIFPQNFVYLSIKRFHVIVIACYHICVSTRLVVFFLGGGAMIFATKL